MQWQIGACKSADQKTMKINYEQSKFPPDIFLLCSFTDGRCLGIFGEYTSK